MDELEKNEGLDRPDGLGVSRLTQDFVEHWGLMARSWGINATMGELFALLFISGDSWTADELREALRISRGNASMNLRELMTWGLVHRTHRQGQRREFYAAEGDVWTLFRRIVQERKRRELDPTLDLLEQVMSQVTDAQELTPQVKQRIGRLLEFFRLMDRLSAVLVAVEPEDIRAVLEWLSAGSEAATGPPGVSGKKNPEGPLSGRDPRD